MPKYLTAQERETSILMNDAEDVALITTHQSSIITKLSKNPSAVLIEEGAFGRTRWASYEIPANLISFRTKTKVGQNKGVKPTFGVK